MGKSGVFSQLFAKKATGGGGSGPASVSVDGLTVFGDGLLTQLHAAPGYIDITLNDAVADTVSNTVIPGWYRIINWNIDGVETNVVGFYTETYENDDGFVRFREYGIAELMTTSGNILLQSEISIGNLGFISMYEPYRDILIRITQNIGTIAIGNSVAWDNASWFNIELVDCTVNNPSAGYIQNLKGSYGDTFTFFGDNPVEGLNPGRNRNIEFIDGSIYIRNSYIESNRTIQINSSQDDKTCINGIHTFFKDIRDGDISGSTLVAHESHGDYCMNLGSPAAIDVISRNNSKDADIICLRRGIGGATVDIVTGGSIVLHKGTNHTMDQDNEHIFLVYRQDRDMWYEVSRLDY